MHRFVIQIYTVWSRNYRAEELAEKLAQSGDTWLKKKKKSVHAFYPATQHSHKALVNMSSED